METHSHKARRTFYFNDGSTFNVPQTAELRTELSHWVVTWDRTDDADPYNVEESRFENVIPREAVKYLQYETSWRWRPDDDEPEGGEAA